MAQLTTQQAFDLAVQHHQAGQLHEAEQLYRQILARQPEHFDALHRLGMIAGQVGRNDIAVDLIRRSIKLNPLSPEAYSNLGHALKDDGQVDEAIAACRQAITLNPNLSEAHNNLGIALRGKGQFDEAVAAHRQAIALTPNSPQAHNNLGDALQDIGRLDEAVAAYKQAIALSPSYSEAYNNLGIALRKEGELDQAIAAYRQALAIRLDFAEAYNNLGNALKDLGQFDEAVAAFRQAIALRPNLAEAYNNLGNALKDLGQFDEAVAAFRQAIALRPNLAEAYNNLGNTLKDLGQHDEAIAFCRRAVALKPNYALAHSNLLFAMQYHPSYDAQAILEEHRRWNRLYAEPLRKFILGHSNDRHPDRRLRIGYISPDFCDHPVGRFLMPLLANHDQEQFEIFCYSGVPARKIDDVTKRLRGYADRWLDVTDQNDEQLAEQIRMDQIDLLIDTAAHTANNRMLLFARKPAPVQITSLFTTGLSAMDYRLTDHYFDPPGQGDEFYSEQSIRLPKCYWCFEPTENMPEVNAVPALSAGHITFGSFNNFAKINVAVLRLWIDVLKATPGSRLILQCPLGDHRDGIQKLFEAAGIALGRLELVHRGGKIRHYFERYHRVDIGLDPTPYAGHTTSFDVLWMGVPLVTLAGRTVVGRTGVSILSNIGLTELIARTPEEYVSIAANLAGDLPRLRELRATMRERMLASPVMDAPAYARDVEAAYRSAWHTWCETVHSRS